MGCYFAELIKKKKSKKRKERRVFRCIPSRWIALRTFLQTAHIRSKAVVMSVQFTEVLAEAKGGRCGRYNCGAVKETERKT